MIAGKSLFESLLDRMDEEIPEAAEEEEVSARIRGLSTGFVAPAMEGVSVSLHRIDGAYLENTGEDAAEKPGFPPPTETEALDPVPEPIAEPSPPPLPPHLLRQLPAEIAEDLGIKANDTVAILQERRRAFARTNHPDRMHEVHRGLANQRMTTANLLIDQAISRLAAMARLGLM
jgi:hypothetical protein